MESNIFKHPTFGEVRTAGTPEQPLFCANDVCKALGYTNSRKAISDHVDDPDVTKRDMGVQTGVKADGTPAMQEVAMTFVNESGLYSLIFGSKLDNAKEFKRWVTSEVLPSIRKSGGYMAASPDETPEQIMARALKVADETLKRREQQLKMANSQIEEQAKQIEADAPYVNYTKEVLQSTSTFTLTQVSKDLGFRSIHAFTSWCQKLGILYRQSGIWMPHSKFSGRGLFATRTAKFVRSDNTIGSSLSTVITEMGRAYLHTMLEKKGAAL